MGNRPVMLDDETYERLETLSKRQGTPMDELVKAWTETAVLAAGLIRNLEERDAKIAALKARERAARAKVSSFSARDNVPREHLYRG